MSDRFEAALRRATDRLIGSECPAPLNNAIEYALFPAGHRFRPRLCYAVAAANEDPQPTISDAAAVALEFIHTASLVQDDLPAFDNGLERRGKPTVHRLFGESTAILVADALIIGAFQHIAVAATPNPYTAVELTVALARAAGTPVGAVAGQAWEAEQSIALERYHQQKTAALFEASTMMGALAAGADAEPWRALGRMIGQAYQLADDLADAADDDAAPNMVTAFGAKATQNMLKACLEDAGAAIPPCQSPDKLRMFLREIVRNLAHETMLDPSVPAPAPKLVSVAGAR